MKKTIYILRDQALGDVLCVEPMLTHYLNLGAKVVFISRYASVFNQKENLVLVDRPSIFLKLKLKFLKSLGNGRRIIDLNNSYEQTPNLSILDSYLKRADVSISKKNINPRSFDIRKQGLFDNGKKVILFHIQAPSQKLSYRDVHGVNWTDLENGLNNLGYHCVELISNQSNYSPILKNHFKHDIPGLFSAVNEAHYFVGLDSGPAHIANMLDKTSFVFFGSVNPELRLTNHTGLIFQNPCDRAGCYHLTKGYEGSPCVYEDENTTPPCCTFKSEHILLRMEAYLTQNSTQ